MGYIRKYAEVRQAKLSLKFYFIKNFIEQNLCTNGELNAMKHSLPVNFIIFFFTFFASEIVQKLGSLHFDKQVKKYAEMVINTNLVIYISTQEDPLISD